MRRAILTASSVSAVLWLAAGCKSQPDGLPPATEWQTEVAPATDDEGVALPPAIGVGRRGARDPNDPHAGVDLGGRGGGDPHAGIELGGRGGDPHAGLDMGGGDPHAGVDMSGTGGGVDVTQLGLEGPDPDRPIDPTRRVAGTILANAAAKARATAGTSIFLVVKRAGPSGEPVGSALAVEKLSWKQDGVAFELTDAQAMIAGTELTGDVIVTARYDQDSDAISKQPGDIVGQVRAKIPADGLKLTLDTVLP